MNADASAGIVIVGAGHAGGSAAVQLRQDGWQGAITLVGNEPLAPYQRPPLSKGWLAGTVAEADLLLRPPSFYAERGIDTRLSARATAIDPAARTVTLDDGSVLGCRALVLATGSRLRRLPVPGAGLAGVLELRTVADAGRVRDAIGPGRRIAVIGGGYVGLEVAASACQLGAEVTVIEREARLLARVASVELSAFFAGLHRARGVRIETGATVRALEARNGAPGAADPTGTIDGAAAAVGAVVLDDGRRFECDAAIVGIGALAEDALAVAAGVACEDGILVDDACRTSVEGIHAIGDCTRRPVARYGRRLRLESVQNALEQARQVSAHLCGKPPPKTEAPWFWSDQYDARLQIAGMAFDVERTVVRGDPAAGRFAVFHLGGGDVVQCVEAVNSPQEFVAGRMLVGAARAVDPMRLADISLTMKDLTR